MPQFFDKQTSRLFYRLNLRQLSYVLLGKLQRAGIRITTLLKRLHRADFLPQFSRSGRLTQRFGP